MLSMGATNERNSWMNDVVVIESDGSVLRGSYDVYGSVNGREIGGYEFTDNSTMVKSPECYHRKCWEASGRPVDYTEGSEDARDQGWFFDDKDHDVDPPEHKTKHGV